MFGYGFNHMGWGWPGFFLGPFFMIIFWIIIAIIVILLFRNYGERSNAKTESSAMDILKERYAKGEINKKEYEEKKRDINKD